MSFDGSLQDLIQSIKTQVEGKSAVTKQKLIIMEFMTYIWYCVGNRELNKGRLLILKDYIDKNG